RHMGLSNFLRNALSVSGGRPPSPPPPQRREEERGPGGEREESRAEAPRFPRVRGGRARRAGEAGGLRSRALEREERAYRDEREADEERFLVDLEPHRAPRRRRRTSASATARPTSAGAAGAGTVFFAGASALVAAAEALAGG